MAERYDVFLSYARADAEQVRRLAENLHNAGLDVFFDEWEIGPGDVLVHRLDHGLLNSRNGVLCVTPASLSRPWVLEEYAAMVTRAVERKLHLIPVLLTDAELPPLLASRVWIDLRTADGPEYERKVRDLVAALKGERPGPPPRREGEILARPGTAFRAEGPLRRRLRISPSAVVYLDEDGNPRAEHAPRGLSYRTRFHLGEMEKAHRWRTPEDAPLLRKATAGAAAQESTFHTMLLEIGEALTRELLEGAVGEALFAEVEEVQRLGFPLELGLEVDGSLADLPWETLRLPEPGGLVGPPLALHPNIRLFRSVAGLGPTPALSIPGPLRILVAIGSPEEQNVQGELLDMEDELSRILDAVEPARKQKRASYVRVIERGTVKAIREALRAERYHVLHVTCHAVPGVLVLEKEDGSTDLVSAERFYQEALPAGRRAPLVVLAGCATALSARQSEEGESALPSLARQLLEQGVPAVLATQATVSDPYATELGARLYRALATFESPDPLEAFTEARRTLESDRQAGELKSRVVNAEWATPALYLRGPSRPLYNPKEPFEEIQPPQEPAFATGVVVRRVGEFVGRRREERRILQSLRKKDGAGVLLHGIGGVGKSSLSAEVLKSLHEEGWVIATLFGKISLDAILTEVGQRLLGHYQLLNENDRRHFAERLKKPDIDWENRFTVLAQQLLPERPLIVLLDNFEDNFVRGEFRIENDDLAEILSRWLLQPGRSRLLITSRQPFDLPNKAHRRLADLHLGPLSLAEIRKLIWRLPGIDALSREDQFRAYTDVGGHPRALEYLDALLRGGEARFPDISERMEEALKAGGIKNSKTWLAGTEGDLDHSLVKTVTLAVEDVLLDELLDRLNQAPLAAELLTRASVYQIPVDLIGLAWQVADKAPDKQGQVDLLRRLRNQIKEIEEQGKKPGQELREKYENELREYVRPPIEIPEGLHTALEQLLSLGLLSLADTPDSVANLHFVHRWTASVVIRQSPLEVVKNAHRRAAQYWLWRVERVPQAREQEVEELLQARHHYREAGDLADAVKITERVCSQLDTWGATQRIEQLWQETLQWIPPDCSAAANISHNLGVIAQDKGDYEQALDRYRKSLFINEELGNRAGMATSYHQLGIIAQDCGDYEQASEQYKKALQIFEELGNRAGMASSYQQLGIIAQDRGDDEQASEWYKKSLQIEEELGNRVAMAKSYHQIGRIAQYRGDYEQALDRYKKSLFINEELGNRAGMAQAYHQLGMVTQDRGDYEQASEQYKKSLQIFEELGNRAGMATSYHQLGNVAYLRSDYEQASEQYKKSLQIHEELGNWVGMANSYHQLGIIAQERSDYEQASEQYKKSLQIKEELGNRAGMASSYHQLGRIAQDRGDYEQASEQYKKALQINEELGNRVGMATSYGQLGVLAMERGNVEEAVPFQLKSLAIHLQIGSPNIRIDLDWLSRQQEALGESRFTEILREHLDEDSSKIVLDLMAQYAAAQRAEPPA